MGRGANKETPIEVKGEKERVVVGLKRSRPIICVELSLPRRVAYLEFKATQTGRNCPAGWASLLQF
jgi:hypothetical protein